MKNKKMLIALILVAILIGVTIIAGCIRKRDINGSENKTNRSNDTNIITLNKFELNDRTILAKDNVIYVGENNKELQNGFYDLKIVLNPNEIKVYLNKLWYKKYNEIYVEEEYLANVCRQLVSNLEFSKNKVIENNEDLEYVLYKYIMDNYIMVRQGENAQIMEMDSINVKLENEESIPVLIIRGV